MPISLGIWDRLSPGTKKKVTRILQPAWLGTLRRTTPLNYSWGNDRGTPVDRYFIEKFLAHNSKDIRGRTLEVGSRDYTDQFGHAVEISDVLDNREGNLNATVIADLDGPLGIPSEQFDCLVFTQVLQFIFNIQACVAELHRILRPGGVLLATLPSVSRIDPSYGMEKDCWRFTGAGCQRMFEETFGKGQATVYAYGNVLTCIAFLAGFGYEELSIQELEEQDPMFPLLIAVRAEKRR